MVFVFLARLLWNLFHSGIAEAAVFPTTPTCKENKRKQLLPSLPPPLPTPLSQACALTLSSILFVYTLRHTCSVVSRSSQGRNSAGSTGQRLRFCPRSHPELELGYLMRFLSFPSERFEHSRAQALLAGALGSWSTTKNPSVPFCPLLLLGVTPKS